jgi:hypothetical protein
MSWSPRQATTAMKRRHAGWNSSKFQILGIIAARAP